MPRATFGPVRPGPTGCCAGRWARLPFVPARLVSRRVGPCLSRLVHRVFGVAPDRLAIGANLNGLYIIPILASLIIIHEFGHFFAARSVGVTVEEFGIGIPPRIKGWRWK